MAKKKFYAVRSGRTTGIFLSWEECRAQVTGAEGAEYKAFSTRAEAEAYLSGATVPGGDSTPETPYPVPENTMVAFVDGSFDVKTKRYGYGCVLLTPDGNMETLNGVGDHPEAATARNVAGELVAAAKAMRRAWESGYQKLRICHDYSGIAAWYEGRWKANSYVAKEYVKLAEFYRSRLQVSFEKIAAHTGVTYNEAADRLAKAALGIGEKNE